MRMKSQGFTNESPEKPAQLLGTASRTREKLADSRLCFASGDGSAETAASRNSLRLAKSPGGASSATGMTSQTRCMKLLEKSALPSFAPVPRSGGNVALNEAARRRWRVRIDQDRHAVDPGDHRVRPLAAQVRDEFVLYVAIRSFVKTPALKN